MPKFGFGSKITRSKASPSTVADSMMKRNYYNSPPAADAISGETDGTSVGASRGAGTDSAIQPKTRASRGKARARNAAKDGGGPAGELADRT